MIRAARKTLEPCNWGSGQPKNRSREPDNPRTGGFVSASCMHRVSLVLSTRCVRCVHNNDLAGASQNLCACCGTKPGSTFLWKKVAAGFLGLTGGTRTSIQSELMGRFLWSLHQRPQVATTENFRNAGSSLAFHTPEVFFQGHFVRAPSQNVRPL